MKDKLRLSCECMTVLFVAGAMHWVVTGWAQELSENPHGVESTSNPDGSISDLDVIQGNPNSMLSVVSADSIQQSSNLIGPFPDDLKKDKPNGFPWQLAFRIY